MRTSAEVGRGLEAAAEAVVLLLCFILLAEEGLLLLLLLSLPWAKELMPGGEKS